MKIQKSLLTLIASAVLAHSATAQIDITGSTAGRAAVHSNIITVLTGPGNTLTSYAYSGAQAPASASPGSSTQAIYHGTVSGTSVIIRTFWNGSVNGIQDVIQAIPQNGFFETSVLGNATGQGAVSGPLASNAVADQAPEIGFSDVFQTSTAFSGLVAEEEPAVIPFKWFKNEASAFSTNTADNAKITSVTALQLRRGYSGGTVPLSFFSGVAADETKLVRFTGRNSDSGTRLTAMAEIGRGTFGSIVQYGSLVLISGNTIINSIGAPGNGGQSSGANVARFVGGQLSNALITANTAAVIGYIGASDWQTAVDGGATELPYNGQAYSEDNVRNGKYTFWGYLHMNRMNLTGSALAFFNQLNTAIAANPGSGLITVGSMEVNRTADGGIPAINP